MNGLGDMLRDELGAALCVLDLDATSPLEGSADIDIDVRWEGTGLDSNESERLVFASQSYAVRCGRRASGASARVVRGVVTGLGTDLMEASYDALRLLTGVDGARMDSTWELTETGARIQVWTPRGEHLIANLVAI